MHAKRLCSYGDRKGLGEDVAYETKKIQALLMVESETRFSIQKTEIAVRVPVRVQRSGKTAIPNLLVDHLRFPIGIEEEDAAWGAECHEAFVALTRKAAQECHDPILKMIDRFYARHKGKLADHPLVKAAEFKRLDIIAIAYLENGVPKLVSERPAVEKWWTTYYKASGKPTRLSMTTCSVTGEPDEIQRTHPTLQIPGGRPTGVRWTTCNKGTTTESYGQSQGEGSRVGKRAALLMKRATEDIIRNGGSFRMPGNVLALVIPRDEEGDRRFGTLRALVDPRVDMDPKLDDLYFDNVDGHRRVIWDAMRTLFQVPHTGQFAAPPSDVWYDTVIILPNGPRIAVVGYHEATYTDLIESARQWYDDLAVGFYGEIRREFPLRTKWLRERSAGQPVPSNEAKKPLRGLLDSLMGPSDLKHPDQFNPMLSYEFTLAAMDRNHRIPPMALTLALDRIQVDIKSTKDAKGKRRLNPVMPQRIAILKAVINRELRMPHSTLFGPDPRVKANFKELSPMLDETRREPTYLHARMLAAAERLQRHSIPHVKQTITDRIFTTLSTNPRTGMPLLMENIRVHLAKLLRHDETIGLGRWNQQIVKDIQELLPSDPEEAFPQVTTPFERALFAKGYFDERFRKLPKWEDIKDGNGHEAKEPGNEAEEEEGGDEKETE